jgi:ribosomal protein S27AE
MTITEALRMLGYWPVPMEDGVAWISCPWCGYDCFIALTWDRYNCNTCGRSGDALAFVRNAPHCDPWCDPSPPLPVPKRHFWNIKRKHPA